MLCQCVLGKGVQNNMVNETMESDLKALNGILGSMECILQPREGLILAAYGRGRDRA